jgi:hypothetical protein
VTYSPLAQAAAGPDRQSASLWRLSSPRSSEGVAKSGLDGAGSSTRRAIRASQLWPALAIGLALTLAACSSGSKSPTVASIGTDPTTTTASQASASSSGGDTPLAEGLAYAKCMRSHGVPNWPDPVATPSGSYGFRTTGVDPHSAGFQRAGEACKSLSPQWWTGGQQLSPSQQQAWLTWAKCIRAHGMPDFADPTFPGGGAVSISGAGGSTSPQLQSAMDACKSQMPSTGGIGG